MKWHLRLLVAGMIVASSVLVGCPLRPAPSALAAGATYYVAHSGSDVLGNGSSDRPWASIQKAANAIAGGDTVRVAAGTYNERVTIPATKSGVAGAPTSFVADGAVIISQGLVVKSSYTELTGFEITPGSAAISDAWSSGQVEISGSHNTLTDFNIHDVSRASGLVFTDNSTAAYNTVRNLRVSHVPHNGVTFGRGTSHNTLSGGSIADFGGNTGIDVENYPQGTYASYCTIEDMTITGPSGWNYAGYSGWAEGDGIRANGPNTTVRRCTIDVWQERHPTATGAPHTDNMQFWVDYDGLLIEDTIIGSYNTTHSYDGLHGASSGINHGGYSNTTDQNWTMRNCILLVPDAGPSGTNNPSDNPVSYSGGSYSRGNLYNNVFWGKRSSFNTAKLKARNNIFMKATYASQAPGYPLGADSDFNLFAGTRKPSGEGAHSVLVASNAAIGFIRPDLTAATNYGINADWRLRATSPAIDAGGTDAATPATDKGGAVRDDAPDIGAYEYDAVAPKVSASTPPVADYEARAEVTGSLTSDAGTPMPSETVALELLTGVGWVKASATQTDSNGAFAVESPALTRTETMRVNFTGGATPVKSAVLRVTPKPYLTSPRAATKMSYRRRYTVYGYLKPRHKSGTKAVKLRAYRYQGGHWVLRKTYYAKAYDHSSYSKYKVAVRLPSRGRWRLRAYHAADADNASALSGYRSVTVR